MYIVSLVIAPTLASLHNNKEQKNPKADAAISKPMESIISSAPEINTSNTIYLR
jgi:hypothetical protein